MRCRCVSFTNEVLTESLKISVQFKLNVQKSEVSGADKKPPKVELTISMYGVTMYEKTGWQAGCRNAQTRQLAETPLPYSSHILLRLLVTR